MSVLAEAVLLGRAFYKSAGKPPSLPVDVETFLIPKVREYASPFIPASRAITVTSAVWPRKRLLSTLLPSDKHERCTILVHHLLNRCYTRFGISVELGNLMLRNEPKYTTVDILKLLIDLQSGLSAEQGTPHYSEELALYGAIEMLAPLVCRQEIDNIITTGANSKALADALLIPQDIADWLINGGWQARCRLDDAMLDAPPIPPTS